MFRYIFTPPATITQRNEVEFGGEDLNRKGPCLIGPNPRVVLRPNQVVLRADKRKDATTWKLSFHAGDALLMVMQPGDEIYMTRGPTSDLGLSLLRQGDLVVAVGHARSVPLGRVALRSTAERVSAPPWLGGQQPQGPVQFRCGSEERSIGERESGEIGDYDLYVERLEQWGFPGKTECVAISRKEVANLKIAAMRSAILLANSNQETVGWEFFGDSHYGL